MSRGRMPKYGAKRDKTDPVIREALRDCGMKVMPLSAPKVNDLAVYNPTLARWFMIDAKSEGGKPTEHQNWEETIGPGAIPFCETIEEALTACRASVIWRASVGNMTVLTEFNVRYYCIVYVPGSGGPSLATWMCDTYEKAKVQHEAAKIAAMNYRDFQTPFSEMRQP
jgi:hypothetical protein